MQSSPQSPEHAQCPICRAEVSPDLKFCGACGSKIVDTPAEEIRGLNYLLSELARWEAEGFIGHEQAKKLHEDYERRREELRAQLVADKRAKLSDAQSSYPPAQVVPDSQTVYPQSSLPPPASQRKPSRALLEMLAEPHTIRILLYTGAAMLVVGVVIWLRDILYLKLKEPIIQAVLLAIGTVAVTACGWFTTLRTRLHLTGRALTLIGSLLVPINFWFLVRSHLIEGHSRAWLVCALCTLLYAQTAALLRERLYVYLASIASVATAWTLVFRAEREAIGLYALTLMTISLIFIHLSRLFRSTSAAQQTVNEEGHAQDNPQSAIRIPQSSWLWGPPLAHVALAGAGLALLFYMPWRVGAEPSFADGIFRLRSNEYDPSIAVLLFLMGAYIAWFAGRYIYANRRAPLYTISALALFMAEYLAADGFRLSGPVQLLMIAATAFIVGLAARTVSGDVVSTSLHRASLIVCVALAGLIYPVLSNSSPQPITHGMILALLAATYAASGEKTKREERAHAPVVFACAALLVVQAMIHLRAGDEALLAPCFSIGAFGLILLGAGLRRRARVQYFRAGLYSLSLAFVLACLRASFAPLDDAEAYAVPVALLLIAAAYFSARRDGDEYAADVKLLLWAGSLLLSAPLLFHALQYRLLLDAPAPWRDLATLCASLALILFGVLGRMRAPVLVGAISLVLELAALTVTSVDWLQIPLKVYLVSVGALILLVWGLMEFRREQILSLRQRVSERRETARKRFGKWK